MFSLKTAVFFALLTVIAADPYVSFLSLNFYYENRLPEVLDSIKKRTATNSFPSSPTSTSLSSPITVAAGATFTPSKSYTKYDRGSGACSGQSEGGDSDAVFLLEEGATLSHVVIGKNQAEGVHCLGEKLINILLIIIRGNPEILTRTSFRILYTRPCLVWSM